MSDVREPFEQNSGGEGETTHEGGSSALPVAPPPMPPRGPTEPPPVERRPGRRLPSVFLPLVLIGAGVLLLLSNLGYLPWQSWNLLWRLWPLLLVGLGIDLLIGRRSLVGAILSGFLILLLIGGAVVVVLFAQNIPAWVAVSGPAEWRSQHVEYPLGDVERASVTIHYTSLPGYLSALRDSPNLVEGDITYRGQLVFDADVRGDRAEVNLDSHSSGIWFAPDFLEQRDGRWDVKLNPNVPLEFTLDAGSGRCDLDLTGLQINELFLDVGSGAADLRLPADSSFEARIDGGSGRLRITLPESVGMRVELNSGSGAFRPGERFRLVEGSQGDDGVWETQSFQSAEHRIMLQLDQGSGSISLE